MLESPKEVAGQEKNPGSRQCKPCCGKVTFKVGRVEQLFVKKSFFKTPMYGFYMKIIRL